MAEVATEPAGFERRRGRLSRELPSRPEVEGVGIHRPLRARDRRLRGRRAGATIEGAEGGDGPAAGRGARLPRRAASRSGSARWSPADDPFVARNDAAWRDGVLVHVPAGVRVEEPIRIEVPLDEDGAAVNWRTLIVLEEGAEAEVWEHCVLGRRRDRRAAQLGGRAARRPGGDAALRQHPGHLRDGLDLRHPARRGGARRPPRVDGARLRLGPRQGADGDQARRAGLRGAGHRRLRRRARPAPRLRHDPGARGAEHDLRPRLPRRARRRVDRGLARDDPGRPRRPGDRRLPGEPQPAALHRGPRRRDPRAWRSRPTTSAAPTPPRSPRSTATSSST